MKNTWKNITEYPIVPVFFAICFIVFVCYIVLPQKDFSDMENRFLQKRPSVSASSLLDGSFMDSFETYTNEQIVFRDVFVKCKAVCVWATGASENDGIAKGKDHYLFDKVAKTSDRLHKNIAAITNFAGSTDREVYVAVAPTSTYINSGLLPKGMPVLDEAAAQRELDDALAGYDNAHVIDLFDTLSDHKDEDIFYRTDHHWTTKGAGYAYSKIVREMGLEECDITQYEKHEVGGFLGTHYAKYKGIFVKSDTIEYYDVPIKALELEGRMVDNLMDEEKFKGYDKYAAFMYGNDGRYVVNADKGTGKSLIILKDSYANCLIPYLVMNYDMITVIDPRYFGGSVAKELSSEPDADVLLMYNWTFVNDDNHFYKLVD